MLDALKRYFRTAPVSAVPTAAPVEGRGRATGSVYMSLPEGHRTTLVAGMADMLNYATQFASENNKPGLRVLTEFAAQYDSNTLRKILDDYMNADKAHQSYLAAGAFAAALFEKCRSTEHR